MAVKPAHRPVVPKRARESATSQMPITTPAATKPLAKAVKPRPIFNARPARRRIWRGDGKSVAVGVGLVFTAVVYGFALGF